jgi:hypothetical protein
VLPASRMTYRIEGGVLVVALAAAGSAIIGP